MNEILYGTSCMVKKENDTSSGIVMILSLKGKKLVYLCVRHCFFFFYENKALLNQKILYNPTKRDVCVIAWNLGVRPMI
jgi:hypothetical protein